MNREGVREIADRIVRPAMGDRHIQEIVVREDADWSGDDSFFVDIFVAPGTRVLEGDLSTRIWQSFNRELLAAGERRPSYLRIRDRGDEGEAEQDEEALCAS